MTTKRELPEMGVWLTIRTNSKKKANQYLELINSILADIKNKVCVFANYDGRCTGLTCTEFDREDFFFIRDNDFLKFMRYLKTKIPRGTCKDKIIISFMTFPVKRIRKKSTNRIIKRNNE